MFKSREVRHSVLIRARMRAGGPPMDVCVRNVSSRGMLLLTHEVPALGTYVEILLPDDVVVGRVMWAGERRFGIRAREKIPLHKVIGGQAQAEVVAAIRRPARPGATMVQPRGDARFAGRSLEFLVLVACAVAVAAFAAIWAFRTLSAVSGKISEYL